jgi:hypothetical protein
MTKNTRNVSEYVAWLFKQYQELKQSSKHQGAYKLVDIKEDKHDKVHLSIQVVGKAIVFKSTPEEILADDKLVEEFSSKDIRTITYYACQRMNKPKNKIVIKRFCEKLNRMVFGVKNVSKNQVEEKTAKDISLDKDVIKSLSPEEAHMVGYTSANEKGMDEKIKMDKLREKK